MGLLRTWPGCRLTSELSGAQGSRPEASRQGLTSDPHNNMGTKVKGNAYWMMAASAVTAPHSSVYSQSNNCTCVSICSSLMTITS